MRIIISALVGLFFSTASFAQQASFVLPVAPGGFVHRLANEILPGLSMAAETTLVPEFKPGAAGIIGARHVAEKDTDELIIMIGAAQRWKDTNFNQLKDLQPVAFLGTSPGLIIAKPNKNFQNYHQFLEYSKKNKATYGVVGSSANVQLFRDIAEKYGYSPLEVPFKTGGEITTNILGGHIDAGMTVVDAVLPMIEDGKIIPLAVFSANRSTLLPSVPTLKELKLGTKNESKYYNNVFLWVNRSANPQKVERFKTRLFAYLYSPEGTKALKKLDMQLGGRDFKDAEKYLKSIIED